MQTTNKSKSQKAKSGLLFLLCFTPLISFWVVNPEWLARLIAVAGCCLAFNALIFWHGFNPKTNFIWKRSKWARQTEGTQRFGQRLFRTLTILFGCFILWFVTVPMLIDCHNVTSNGEKCLIHLQGKVTDDEFRFGAYFVLQNLWISENGEPTGVSYGAFCFRRYLGHKDQLQQFLITPNAKLVLECNPVASTKNSLEDDLKTRLWN
jgi:hypothetical protein